MFYQHYDYIMTTDWNAIDTSIGKYLAYLLRHNPPQSIDSEGYVPIDELLSLINQQKNVQRLLGEEGLFTLNNLKDLVANCPKQRYAFNQDETKLRASQGHSTGKVSVTMETEVPPEILYHGTGSQFIKSIMSLGIDKRNRHHVHLSSDYATALNVGSRHGKPAVLQVQALKMHDAGISFFLSDNGVWLTESVPTAFISVLTK